MVHSGGMSESETGKMPVGRTASTVWVEPTGDGVEAGAATTAQIAMMVATRRNAMSTSFAEMDSTKARKPAVRG